MKTDFRLWSDKTTKLTSIIQFPSGKFGFVGSVPSELCKMSKGAWGVEQETSKLFETYAEADKAYKEYLSQSAYN